MKSIAEAIERLTEILKEREPRRSALIADFHHKVFKEECPIEEAIDEVLSELTYDMDFYEPNDEWRKQSDGFYDGERLEEIINERLIKLETIKAQN